MTGTERIEFVPKVTWDAEFAHASPSPGMVEMSVRLSFKRDLTTLGDADTDCARKMKSLPSFALRSLTTVRRMLWVMLSKATRRLSVRSRKSGGGRLTKASAESLTVFHRNLAVVGQEADRLLERFLEAAVAFGSFGPEVVPRIAKVLSQVEQCELEDVVESKEGLFDASHTPGCRIRVPIFWKHALARQDWFNVVRSWRNGFHVCRKAWGTGDCTGDLVARSEVGPDSYGMESVLGVS